MVKNERGQVMVILALVLVGLLAFAGLAVDGGSLYTQRRRAQTAADSAAFAGASMFLSTMGNVSAAQTAALASANTSGFSNDSVTSWVTAQPIDNNTNYQVIIRARIQTSFIQMVYPGAAESTTQAIVKMNVGALPGGNNALVGLEQNCSEYGPSIYFNGSSNVTVTGGGAIWSNATDTTTNPQCQSMVKSGASTQGSVTADGGIYAVGTYSGSLTNVSPTPTVNQTQLGTNYMPPPDCRMISSNYNFSGNNGINPAYPQRLIKDYSNQHITNGNTLTIWPGFYSDIKQTNTNASLIMEPGLYCITGNFEVNGGNVCLGDGTDYGGGNGQCQANVSTFVNTIITDLENDITPPLLNGLMIVMEGGNLTLLGNGTTAMSAYEPYALTAMGIPSYPSPNLLQYFYDTNGTLRNYGGMLIYAPPEGYPTPPQGGNPPSINIGGSGGNFYAGTIFAPSTPCILTGTSGTVTLDSQVYCYTINVQGNGTIGMVFSEGINTHQPPTVDLQH